MFPVKRTIFFKFQLFLGITPVFSGGIVPAFTFAALHANQFHNLFLTRHKLLLRPKYGAFWSALDQNRTDDLILTMDMLCQLSYKGIKCHFTRFRQDSNFGRFSQVRNLKKGCLLNLQDSYTNYPFSPAFVFFPIGNSN